VDARNDLAESRVSPRIRGWSVVSFLCAGAALPWFAWCFYGLRHDDSWLAGLAWALLAGLGSGVAALIGTICGAFALRGGRPRGLAVLAIVLNLGVLVLSAVLLLWARAWF
jgi:hypothetical protein